VTIESQVLGEPGRDNAVFLVADSGQEIFRCLFDCGYACLDSLSVAEIQSLDMVCFSHFHMDHIAGFDSMFRHSFNRSDKPLKIVGPEETIRVVHHRLRGYTWNLVNDAKGSVEVWEFGGDRIRKAVFSTSSGFESIVQEDSMAIEEGVLFRNDQLMIKGIELDHGCVSAGYVVKENEKQNIRVELLSNLGLRPGPWLNEVKNQISGNITIDGKEFSISELRSSLVEVSPGESFAYLTDFRAVEKELERLANFVAGVDHLVCENNFGDSDGDLAVKSHHLTSSDVGRLAAMANIDRLTLFHISDRYTPGEWSEQLNQVQAIFPNTSFPETWIIP